MNCSVISIDLAKNVFQVCALDSNQKPFFNKQVKRSNLLQTLRQFEPTLVVMEACYSSNPWGRRIEKLGHRVKCIPAFMVKPFVVGNKTDRNDALAIAEASFRQNLRFIAIKPVEQQDIQSLQRIRERAIKTRTGDMNQLRGLLAEYGEVCPPRFAGLSKRIPDILEDADNELSPVARRFLRNIYRRIVYTNEYIKHIEQELFALLKNKEDYQLLLSIPGIGPVVASTVLASINDVGSFKNGRQLAAWIGLTPRLSSSGEKAVMGRITKRGNVYLRKLLIQGSRVILNHCHKKNDRLNVWLKNLSERMNSSRAVVALANKLARIIWAVLSTRQPFDAKKACA